MSFDLCKLEMKHKATTSESQAFLKRFELKVEQTIVEHKLFTKEDKVLVAVSGGKDSTVLLSVLNKLGYNLEAVTVDVHIGCYTEDNLKRIKKLCNDLNIKLHVHSFKEYYGQSMCHIRDAVSAAAQQLTSCTVCGVMRRKILNQVTRGTNAIVIATGHNLDDEASSVFMNFLRNKQQQSSWLGPKTEGTSELFVRRVKPLYFISEADIIRYSKLRAFDVTYSSCPCSKEAFRTSAKQFLYDMQKTHPKAMDNIINFFMRIRPALRAHFTTEETAVACTRCGEPAKEDLCRSCKLFALASTFQESRDFTA